MSEESEFSSELEGTWISWFCSLEDHFWFCQVDQEFIRDPSNLYGIKSRFPRYDQVVEVILKTERSQADSDEDPKFLQLYQDATEIYGLIHARFILTPKGLSLMRQKYLEGQFGVCPRVLCQNQNVLPIAVSEEPKTCRVKIFCPRCEDLYNYQPKKKCMQIDGAYFGSAFPHILLMSFHDLKPFNNDSFFSPQIFGFKIHGKRGSGPVQTSLKPQPLNQVNQVISPKITQVPKKNKNKKAH